MTAHGVQAALGPCLGSEPLRFSACTGGVILRVRCPSAVPGSLPCLIKAGEFTRGFQHPTSQLFPSLVLL